MARNEMQRSVRDQTPPEAQNEKELEDMHRKEKGNVRTSRMITELFGHSRNAKTLTLRRGAYPVHK